MKKEKWKPIDDCGFYEVSNMGRVRSYKITNSAKKSQTPKVIKHCVGLNKYHRVELTLNGVRKKHLVHRIVGYAFLNKPDGATEINHKDGNPENNNVDNIEWVTHSENMKHAFRNGTKKPLLGESHPNTTLTEKDVIKIRKMCDEKEFSMSLISQNFGVSISTISRIHKRKRWGHL